MKRVGESERERERDKENEINQRKNKRGKRRVGEVPNDFCELKILSAAPIKSPSLNSPIPMIGLEVYKHTTH